ncbi:MAG: glycosyltransferase family 4 protein [Deltaproteobacteria bacterium]|nr:glycosyltransferase family 4 protein [Deltaproteobacteria bacterium]
MRIGIGAILGVVGGPATYARELVRALTRVDSTTQFVVFTDAPDRLGVEADNLECARATLGSPFLQPFWDQILVPKLVRRYAVDLYHGTKGILPFFGSGPAVVTVHDLAVYEHPHTFSFLQRLHLRSHTPYSVRRALRVIADSQSGRDDLMARFGLAAERVVVVPLAAGEQFHPEPSAMDGAIALDLGLPNEFLLYAGTIQPRKNVEMLVEAFAGLAEKSSVELLICGRLRPGYRPAFLTGPPPQVRYLGPVTDEQLAVLYRRALALCSPSSYEGFGLSLLEAMTSGCLVIAGRNSSVTELVEGGGVLLPELQVDSLRAALRRVLQRDPSLDELRRRAFERARHYRWDETARQTLAVYRSALEESRAGT